MDLRRGDLPALGAAADATASDVHVLFVIDPVLWDGCGRVRRAWLAASIRAAAESYGDRLTVRMGDPVTKVAAFADEVLAGSVHVSAETTPYGARRDARVRERLTEREIAWVATGSPYAVGPGRVRTKDGSAYRVFTPFSRAWREHRRAAHAGPGAARRPVRRGPLRRTSTQAPRPRPGRVPDRPPDGGGGGRAASLAVLP